MRKFISLFIRAMILSGTIAPLSAQDSVLTELHKNRHICNVRSVMLWH